MTVSRALHDSPLIRKAVREEVKRVAVRLGYVSNPLAGALMGEMRRSRADAFRGVLAVLDIDGPVGREPGAEAYHGELIRGATGRARKLGFSADLITVGGTDLSVRRLDAILHARGIRGVFVLPVRQQPDLTNLDWTHFSGIYADFLIKQPCLHTVCPDHYRAMLTLLDRLRALGYRRAGLVLNTYHNQRLLQRWEAAYHAHHARYLDMTHLPPLIRVSHDEASFAEWFRAVDCDVVLSHSCEVLTWMRRAGARVPETHGFCCLNVLNSPTPCAGMDLQPGLLGVRGMEILIGMVLRNECGAPEDPMTTILPPRWVEGPTVRHVRAGGGDGVGLGL